MRGELERPVLTIVAHSKAFQVHCKRYTRRRWPIYPPTFIY